MCDVPYLELSLEPMPFSNGALEVLPGNGAGLGAGVLATAWGDGNRVKGAGRKLLCHSGSSIAKPRQGNSHGFCLQCLGAPEASLSPRGRTKTKCET